MIGIVTVYVGKEHETVAQLLLSKQDGLLVLSI